MALIVAADPVVAQTVIESGAHEIVNGDDPDGTGPGTQPSPWEISGEVYIGDAGSGALTIENGGQVSNTNGSIGRYFGSGDGTVIVSGTDGAGNASIWTNSGTLSVGDGSSGSLTIEGGGQVSNTNGFIGRYDDSHGTVIISGTDGAGNASTWTNDGELTIGSFGPGELTIEGGGQVSNANGYIGRSRGIKGTVTVTGNNSTWTNHGVDGILYVGFGGTGTLTISNGGQVTNTYGYIAASNTSDGTVLVSGADDAGNASTWTNDGRLTVGNFGVGSLTISDGGLVTSETTLLSNNLAEASGAIALNSNGVLATGLITKGSGSGTLSFDGGILRATSDEADFLRNFDAGDVTIDTGGAVFDTNGFDIGIGAPLTGDGGLTKTGAGVLTLTGGSPDFFGTTTVSGGTLELGHTSSLLYDSLGSGDITLNGGTLDLANLNGDLKNDIVVGASGGTITRSGGIPSIYGGISGSGALTFSGSGEIDVWGNNRSFSGATTVSSGAVLRAMLSSSLSSSSAYTIQSGGTLQLYANSASIGSLAGAGDVNTSTGKSLILTVGADDTSTGFSGVIADGTGTLGLAKTGAGTLTLTGANTYTGATSVSQGTLVVGDSSHPAASIASTVTVEDGGTLGGSGTVGTTTVADGGTIAPGNSVGELKVDGDLLLSSGSILDFELGSSGTAPDLGNSDRIEVTGDLTLDGTLNLAQSGDGADGTAGLGYYRLMTYNGTLTGNTLAFGAIPTLADPAAYQIRASGGNVDLLVAAAGDDTLQHWQGGDGTWNASNWNWLNQGVAIPVAWAGNHAVFENEPGGFDGGTIAVEGMLGFKGLQFVDEGYRLEGTGALETAAGGSEIRVLADSAQIATEITGTGGITKTQGGTLVLEGANSYSGGTSVLGGSVQISQDANLGSASGGLTLNGGTLATMADMDSARSVTLSGTGAFEVAAGTTLGLTGAIGGAGDLLKRGDGTLILSGANGYEGDTLVDAGTLVGDAAAIRGNIGNGATLVFDQAGVASFAGDIGGLGGTNGQMIKRGAGQLTLDGTSTLDWTIEAGGLAAAADRFTGNAQIGGSGAFTFDQQNDASYVGVLSGAGSFTKDGGRALLLSGNSSGFAGTTNVAGGTLLVGDRSGNGALGGSLDVLDGATLGGSGTVGSGVGSLVTIASGGTLASGNSIGTLTIDGDLAFEAGSRLAVEVNPLGTQSDLVAVTGKATLGGGGVAHIGASGDYDLRSNYTILSAGTLEGKFDSVTSDFAFLDPNVLYDRDAGTVTLKLERNDIDFAAAALTRNQIATANGVESIGLDTHDAVYDAIARLGDDDVIRASFDALSGEIHASAQSALIAGGRFIRDAANDRIRAAFGEAGAAVTPVLAYGPGKTPVLVSADHGGPVVWSTGFGSWGSTGSDGNAASLDRNTSGVVVGADGLVGDWRLGILAGYSQSSFDADNRLSSGTSDNYHLGVYAGTERGNLAFRTGAAYTWHNIETSRFVSIPGITDSLSADYNAGTFQAFGELGYGIEMGNTRLEPFVNLAHVSVHSNGFTENGGAAALSAEGGNTHVTFTTLGVRGEHETTFGTVDATLHGMVGWRHAFGDTTPQSTHGLAAGDAFTVAGVPIAQDAAVLEAGLDLDLTPKATFGLSYTGQIASDAHDQGFKANLSVSF